VSDTIVLTAVVTSPAGVTPINDVSKELAEIEETYDARMAEV